MPRKKRINKLYTLDTETIGLDGDIKRIAVYDGQDITYGYRFEEIEWVFEKSYQEGFQPHVYVHNLEFDIRKMPTVFELGNVNWNKTILLGNKYAKIHCKNYVFHDSFKILPMGLDKLSKGFDLEHGKMDLWAEVEKAYPGQYRDKEDYFRNCDPDDPIYVKYLGYDVISLYELMEKVMDFSGLELDEMVKIISTASLSRYLFKKGYKGHNFISDGKRKTDFQLLTDFSSWSSKKPMKGFPEISYYDVEKKIRDGYYGGRTEVFTPRLKKSVAYHYDVNSLYPSVMIDNEFPIGIPVFYDEPETVENHWKMWENDHTGKGFLKCVVNIPMQHIPPLPAKMGKLVFPAGVVSGTWVFEELEYAVENCDVEILEYQEMIFFKKSFAVFHNFVSTFYQMKEEGKRTGNGALTQLAKLILNTAYGWTALIRERTELKNIDQLEKLEEKGTLLYTNEELGYCMAESFVVADYVQVAVGAYVTAYARLVMLDALRKCEKGGGTVYYCDTDSIVTDIPMPDEIVHSTKIGYWDLEGVLSDGIFLFPKVYAEVKQDSAVNIKFKGVSKSTQHGMKYGLYEQLLSDLQNGSTEKVTVEKGKEMLRSVSYAQKTGRDPNILEIRDKKINLGNIQKRNMDYRNNSSEPWYFETLEEFLAFDFNEPIKPWDEHGNLFNPMSTGGKTK